MARVRSIAKAERLIAEGVPIQILSEMDFMELLGFL